MRPPRTRPPSTPVRPLAPSPARLFASAFLTLLALAAGCDSRQTGADDESAPPIPVAEATEPEGVSISDLRRQLGANRNAQFVRTGGEIAEVELFDSGVSDLAPLRGLTLRRLGISGLPVRDLAPLAGMPLEVLTAEGTEISDLTPLRGAPLRELYLRDTEVADLSPVAGAPIEQLNVVGTPVADLAAVRDMPLGTLWVASTPIDDLSPLAGKSLASLDVENTPVADLAVLSEMESLRRLNLAGSAVTDLTPLAGLELERLIFTPAKITKGIEAARTMPSLQTLGTTFDDVMPSQAFWNRYDAGEFAEPDAPAATTPSATPPAP